VVDQLLERADTDVEVGMHKIQAHLLIRRGCFNPLWGHGRIAHQKQGSGGDTIVETGREYGGRFHIDSLRPDVAQVLFKGFVMLPHPSVGGVDRSSPVIEAFVAYGSGNSLLQGKRRERRHFRWQVVVARAFTANGSDGQDKIPNVIFGLEAPTFAQKQYGLRTNSREQIEDGGRHGRTHPKIYEGDAVGRTTLNRLFASYDFNPVLLREKLQILPKICQQYVGGELLQCPASVAGKPVFNNLLFSFHITATNIVN